jgi:hypothetical protein
LVATTLRDYCWIISILGQVNTELLGSVVIICRADRCEVAYDKLINSIRIPLVDNRLSLTS